MHNIYFLLFHIVESFTDMKGVWKLGNSGFGKRCLHGQSLRRRKQVANINIRVISCVGQVEQCLGRTALRLRGLTDTWQPPRGPAVGTLAPGGLQEHGSGPQLRQQPAAALLCCLGYLSACCVLGLAPQNWCCF